MYLAGRLARIVAFMRAGYPTGWSVTGYVPLAALLPRRVSDDEIATISSQLVTRPGPISNADVGVEITRVIDDMPSPRDIERVQRRLDTIGRGSQALNPRPVSAGRQVVRVIPGLQELLPRLPSALV